LSVIRNRIFEVLRIPKNPISSRNRIFKGLGNTKKSYFFKNFLLITDNSEADEHCDEAAQKALVKN